MQKLTRSFLLAGAALGLAACGDDVSVTPPTPAPAAVVTAVTVSPATISIAAGQTVVATAQVSVSSGSGTVDKTVAWSSADASIATVGAATGAITGVKPGTTTIRATAGGVTGAATVTVTLGVQSVSVTPSSIALQVGATATPSATVTRDAGVDGSVTWTSAAPAIASVNATTGEITGVAVGTTSIIAASKADPSKTAALAVVVSAVPNTLQSLTVAPTSAALGVGGTVKIVPNATTVGGAAVTYSYQTSNAAVATVDAAGLVTAVGNGTAIITTTATTSTNALSASTTITVASASVSIASITQGGLGNPVDISDVDGQIEVTMNIAAGNQTLDSVRVTLGGQPAATQTFTVNGAPNAPVTLSINTAAYKINADSTATVSFLNGTTGVQAQLFTQGTSGPTASNTITITLNNSDSFHARWTLPANTATSPAGLLWYGGSTTVNVIPVIYTGNTVSQATFGLQNCSSAQVTDAASPFVATFSCASTQNANVSPVVSASLFTAGNPGPTAPSFANQAQLTSVRIDNVGPSGSFALTGAAPNNWIGGPAVSSSNWYQYVSSVTDGGVGAKDSTAYIFQFADAPDTVWTNHAADPSDVPENATDFTNSAYNDRVQLFDRLGNRTIVYLGGGSTPGAQAYGVDVTAPTLDYLTATQQPLVVLPATDTLGNTKILHNTVNVTGGINSTNGLFGVRMRDTRSGFDVTSVGAQISGLFKNIARLGVSGSSCAFGGTACAYVRDTAIVDLSDPTYRRDSINVYGALTATTPGYYTYSAYAVDRAGNTSSTITKQIAIDIAAPLITGLPVPASLIGAQPLAIIPTGLDDLEIWKASAYLTYPNLTQNLHFPLSVFPAYGTPFDAVLTTPVGFGGPFGAAGVTLPINFLRGIDLVQAVDSAPPAVVTGTYAPTALGAQFYDIKRSSTAFVAATPDSSGTIFSTISTGLVAPGVPFSTIGVGKWFIFGAGTSGSSIQARAVTSTVITNPPFPQVAFFRLSGGTWTYLGKVDAVPGTNPTIFDSGTNRFWTYTLTGVSPALASTNNIIAVGMSAAGDGLSSRTYIVP